MAFPLLLNTWSSEYLVFVLRQDDLICVENETDWEEMWFQYQHMIRDPTDVNGKLVLYVSHSHGGMLLCRRRHTVLCFFLLSG